MLFDHEITNLRGEILATTRTDRAGMGPGGADPVTFRTHNDPSVTIPLSDLREAEVTLAVVPAELAETLWFDSIQGADTFRIGALGRMLRVYFRGQDQPVFWDVIATPDWRAAGAGQVALRAQQHPRLRAHFLRFGDDVVGTAEQAATDPPTSPYNPIDYRTLYKIVEAAENTLDQNHYPQLGVAPGTIGASATPWAVRVADATGGTFTLTVDGQTTAAIACNASAATLQAELEALSNIAVGEVVVQKPAAGFWGIYFTGTPEIDDYRVTGDGSSLTGTGAALTVGRAEKQIERGAGAWGEIVAIQESRYGPDFEFEPRDDLGVAAFDNDLEPWPYISQLNTWDHQGTDRTATVEFTYGPGGNLADAGWEPGGPDARNEVKIVSQGTDDEPGHRIFGHDLTSWRDIGIYSDWQNPEGGNAGLISDEALQDLANDLVAAQGRPPNYLTLTTRIEHADSPTVPVYGVDYWVGDDVSVEVAKDGFQYSGPARVTKVVLRAADKAGNGRTEITVVPKVAGQDSITVGGDE